MTAPLRRRRLQLVLIFAVFLVPIVLAFVLRQSGWQPQRLRNVGELVQPPRDLGTVILQEEGGAAFAWRDADYRWTLLLLAFYFLGLPLGPGAGLGYGPQ